MGKDPAFLFYYVDFQHGTRKMSFEEKGAYIELLCEQADSGHLSLNDIKRALNSHFPIWESIRYKFTVDNEGLVYNAVLEQRLLERRVWVNSRLKNLKKKKKPSHMDSHMDSHMEDENEDENINKKEIKREQKKVFDFEAIWELYPKKIDKKEALGYFNMTVKTDIDFENIKKAVKRYCDYIQKNMIEMKFVKTGGNWFGDWESWANYKEQGIVNDSIYRKL